MHCVSFHLDTFIHMKIFKKKEKIEKKQQQSNEIILWIYNLVRQIFKKQFKNDD